MALEKFKLNLTGVNATDTDAFATTSGDVSITSSGAPVTAKTSIAGSPAKLEDFGTLKASGSKEVTFAAAADMKSGEYSVTNGTNASLKTFDARKASANLSLTTDLVSVASGVLKGGSGNDTILVTSGVNGKNVSVSGGKGADLFQVQTTAGVVIADYNYAEGDKISVGANVAMDKFDTAGNMTVGANSTVKGSSADGLYKFGVIDVSGGSDKKYDYVAAANGADVKYTAGTDHLVFKAAAGNSNIVIDASKAASTKIQATGVDADITLGGKTTTENYVSVGGTDKTAVVDLGYGKDSITVGDDTALTLKVGREDGANTLKSTAGLDSDDTLVLTTGKISDVSMSGDELRFGATSVKGAFAAGTGEFNVQFGSDEAKKLAYTTTNIAYNKDVNYYLGAGNSKITVAADASTDDVVLDMVNFTKGITSVGLDGIAAKANVDIIATGDASIKAAVAHNGVERKFDLTAKNIVGNNLKQNKLDVDGAAGVDRIVLSDAKGNADKVKGFKAGEDILVLSDVDKLTEKTFSIGDTANDVVLQKSKASIAGALQTNTDFDVVLSDGTAKKVALANGAGLVTATQKTTTVINQNNNVDGKVTFDIKEATENNAAFVVDMTGTVSNAIDYLGKFTTIDATVNAANALIIGKEAITTIKATGSADHGAVVWAGAKANADITFALSNPGADDAGNILWTGAQDGASSVTGFDAKDKLYVYGVDGLSKAAIVEGFDFDDNKNVVYKTGESSMTVITGGSKTDNINVMYMDSTAEGGFGYQKVAYTNAAGTAVNFVTDVDVYIGTGNATVKVANDAVAEGNITAINLSNKGAGSVEDGGAYYKDIHNIDASASAGKFLLIGDNTDDAQLKGGVNGNAIWGGGNAGQIMTGSTGVADIFWFGSKDGYDKVNNFEKEDAVYLYDATSIDAVKITADGNNAKVVFKDTECTLTLTNVSKIDDVKFMLNNADGGYDYYKYDSKTSAFKKA